MTFRRLLLRLLLSALAAVPGAAQADRRAMRSLPAACSKSCSARVGSNGSASCEEWAAQDSLSLLRQLGLLPTPAAAGAP